MEFFLGKYIKEDVQSNITDADLLSQAAQLEAKKNAAKKTFDQAQERYNNEVQQIDNQLVQLLNTQAQRNAQKASANNNQQNPANQENESQNLNEGGDLTAQIIYLDYFMPKLLGSAYDEKAIKATLEKEGLVVEDNYHHGLILHISEPDDLEIFYETCENNGLDRDEVEEFVRYQIK